MAGIHAEEVNRLKAGLFRSYQRQIYGWKMSIGEIVRPSRPTGIKPRSASY